MSEKQLCWSCDRVDCPWRKSLKPVDGWNAERTVTVDGLPSYEIYECPLYHKWQRYFDWEKNGERSEYSKLKFKPEILAQMRPKDRDIIDRRWRLKQTWQQMSEALGVRQGTVKQRLENAVNNYYEIAIKCDRNEVNWNAY